MEAITREEKIMSGENLMPITRKEMFLAKAAGMDVETPEPITREEMFLSKIQGGGGGGGGDNWLKQFVEGEPVELHDDTITTIVANRFKSDTTITDVNLPNVVTINANAFEGAKALQSLTLTNTVNLNRYCFSGCTALKTAIIPNATLDSDYIFHGCTSLEYVDASDCGRIGSATRGYTFSDCQALRAIKTDKAQMIGERSFWDCTSLTDVRFPCLHDIDDYAFMNCYKLCKVDVAENSLYALSIGSKAFYNACSLKEVTIRDRRRATLVGINAFDGCYHFHGTVHEKYNPDGLKDGYIYVPAELIDTYKSATNWSTFADRFRALEDYTVDGTITGSLDETKI